MSSAPNTATFLNRITLPTTAGYKTGASRGAITSQGRYEPEVLDRSPIMASRGGSVRKVAGVTLIIAGWTVFLAPPVWAWLSGSPVEDATMTTSFWPKYFVLIQAMLAGRSLMRNSPRLTETMIFIAVITALILLVLSRGQFYVAVGLVLIEAVSFSWLHRRPQAQEAPGRQRDSVL